MSFPEETKRNRFVLIKITVAFRTRWISEGQAGVQENHSRRRNNKGCPVPPLSTRWRKQGRTAWLLAGGVEHEKPPARDCFQEQEASKSGVHNSGNNFIDLKKKSLEKAGNHLNVHRSRTCIRSQNIHVPDY